MAGNFKALALVIVVLASPAQASLVNLGDGTVKDTDTNLIWLYDWMYDFNSNAQPCPWQCAVDWAADRTVAGATDWSLPTLDQYQTLWADVGGSLAGLQSNFKNVQLTYWTSSDESPLPSDFAWAFHTASGVRDGDPKTRPHNVVAVRPADMASVPEPASLALVGAALFGVAATRRRSAAASLAQRPARNST